jgi:small conductance mechanosensitive channel
VPNSVVVTSAIVPVREPAAVQLRAWLRPDVAPEDLQELLDDTVQTPTREHPYIDLEEFRHDEVAMRISAVPESPEDGAKLAGEILRAVSKASAAHETEREMSPRPA